MPTEMSDTSYGRFDVQKKRDAVLAIRKMTYEEQAALLQEMIEMDVADNNADANDDADAFTNTLETLWRHFL
jgi:hypothetical protein